MENMVVEMIFFNLFPNMFYRHQLRGKMADESGEFSGIFRYFDRCQEALSTCMTIK